MDFAVAKILIRPFTDFWGPFSFDVTPSLPPGETLTGATTVKSYLNGVESTSALIESGSISVDSATISLRFQYPGDTQVGLHELKFNLVFASGAKHQLTFGHVKVVGP